MKLICAQAGKQAICEECHHSEAHDNRSDHEMNLGDCTISSPCYDPGTGKTVNRVYCVETTSKSELDTLRKDNKVLRDALEEIAILDHNEKFIDLMCDDAQSGKDEGLCDVALRIARTALKEASE